MMETNYLQLDNGEEYVLVDELTYEDKNYFYTLGFDSKKDEINYEKFMFFWHGEDEEGEFVEEVNNDNDLFKKLLALELLSAFSDNPEVREAIEKQLDSLN